MLYKKSLDLFRTLGDRRGIAYLLLGLGIIADDQADHAHAVRCHEESLALFETMGDRRGIANVLTGMATAILHLGETDRAAELSLRALEICLDTGDEEGIIECLEGIALVNDARGEVRLAVRLWAAAAAARARARDTDIMSMTAAKQRRHEEHIAQARDKIGDGPFSEAWETGQATPLEDAVSELLGAMFSAHTGGAISRT